MYTPTAKAKRKRSASLKTMLPHSSKTILFFISSLLLLNITSAAKRANENYIPPSSLFLSSTKERYSNRGDRPGSAYPMLDRRTKFKRGSYILIYIFDFKIYFHLPFPLIHQEQTTKISIMKGQEIILKVRGRQRQMR